MNSVTLRASTMWALLVMEAAAAVPLLGTPTGGAGLWSIAGPIATALFIPLGYLAERWFPLMRTQYRRLAVGGVLALALRTVVSPPQDLDSRSLLVWLMLAFVPSALALGLWWRGLMLATAEVTAADVRGEVALLGGALLALLTLFRAAVRPEPALTMAPVIVFLAAALLALTLARQDAARVAADTKARSLAVAMAGVSQVAAVVVVGVFSPGVLAALWAGLSGLLGVLLWPLFVLLAWLSSFFPAAGVGPPPPLPRPLEPPPLPDALVEQPSPPAWVGVLVLLLVVVVVTLVVFALVRVLLALRPRLRRRGARRRPSDHPTVAGTGGAGRDFRAAWQWLLRRLLLWLSPPRATAQQSRQASEERDARAAYRALLLWARQSGFVRQPAETTRQFEQRLTNHLPTRAETFDLVTRVYEWDHYGGMPPSRPRLAEVERSLRDLAADQT